jgi:ribonucleoside-diphosphate reductase alpha chain
VTETLEADGRTFIATIGLDPDDGQPREIFLSAGKEGSTLNALLADAAVALSVALQHGIPAAALAKSVARLPSGQITPADLDRRDGHRQAASPIGVAIDLLRSFESVPADTRPKTEG